MRCAKCPEPASQTIGTEDLCDGCYLAYVAPLKTKYGNERLRRESGSLVLDRSTGAVQIGLHRPDHGPEFFEVACPICQASWVGPIGDLCWFCAQAAEHQRRCEAQLVIVPPDVDRCSAKYVAAMSAWAARLANAVRAEIISEPNAYAVWNREIEVATRERAS